MTATLHAIRAGSSPPQNGETRTTAPTVSGLKSKDSQQRQSNAPGNPLQAVADRMDVFNRLQRAFNAAGWNLHYLDGESCLAVHRRWQMSQVCQDMRAASALLRRIGGAA